LLGRSIVVVVGARLLGRITLGDGMTSRRPMMIGDGAPRDLVGPRTEALVVAQLRERKRRFTRISDR
jgi:hypothetical protein